MSVKRKTYSAEFKAKLVLEVLEGEKTVNEIASAYGVIYFTQQAVPITECQ